MPAGWLTAPATAGSASTATGRASPATPSPPPAWRTAAGCTLGDIIAESAVFGLAATVAGLTLIAEYIGDYLAALSLGIVFQYFAIAPMRGLSVRDGLTPAAKADVASLTAFEVGLFGLDGADDLRILSGTSAVYPDSPVYWFGMQLGMIAGFFTAWPVNTWLQRARIKEGM